MFLLSKRRESCTGVFELVASELLPRYAIPHEKTPHKTRRMARRHSSHTRAVKRRTTGAVELLAGGALLTLLPTIFGKSMLGPALANLRPVGWLLFVFGGGLLLVQWKFSTATVASRVKPHEAKRSADSTLCTNRVAASSDVRGDNPSIEKGAGPNTPTHAGQDACEHRRGDPSIGEAAVPTAPMRWGRDVFEVIEWRRFEAVIEELFAKAGFETRSQSHGADGGVDVWLHARSDAQKPVSIVQCKHWVGKRVGVDKVRELKGVMASHGMTRGHFATTSTFTSDAIKFAGQNGIHLLDIEGILRLIDKRPQEDQAALLAVAIEGEFWKPTCVNCGTKLVARPGRPGGKPFWGCSSYPRCRTTLPMRAA